MFKNKMEVLGGTDGQDMMPLAARTLDELETAAQLRVRNDSKESGRVGRLDDFRQEIIARSSNPKAKYKRTPDESYMQSCAIVRNQMHRKYEVSPVEGHGPVSSNGVTIDNSHLWAITEFTALLEKVQNTVPDGRITRSTRVKNAVMANSSRIENRFMSSHVRQAMYLLMDGTTQERENFTALWNATNFSEKKIIVAATLDKLLTLSGGVSKSDSKSKHALQRLKKQALIPVTVYTAGLFNYLKVKATKDSFRRKIRDNLSVNEIMGYLDNSHQIIEAAKRPELSKAEIESFLSKTESQNAASISTSMQVDRCRIMDADAFKYEFSAFSGSVLYDGKSHQTGLVKVNVAVRKDGQKFDATIPLLVKVRSDHLANFMQNEKIRGTFEENGIKHGGVGSKSAGITIQKPTQNQTDSDTRPVVRRSSSR